MQTLKLNSRGEAVKQIQIALGITADGIFGPKTLQAVKAFQKSANLTQDGIVGPKTFAAMFSPSPSPSLSPITIIRKPLNVHISKRDDTSIKYLVIHFTAGSHSRQGKALSCYQVFTSRKASADFAVDDVDIVQFNPEPRRYYCWAVGDAYNNNKGGTLYRKACNSNCISIEICSTCTPSTQQAVLTDNHRGWSFTPAVLDNAVKLARHLMSEYNIPLANVIRHYDVSGKLCPGIVGWNDEPLKDITGKKTGEINNSQAWLQFKQRLL